MPYRYYPGCSLEGTALEYDRSTRALLAALDVSLLELDGWTCCGASAAPAVSGLLALALPARNLALAERMQPPADLLVPCSACYLNLKNAAHKAAGDPALRQQINAVLAEEALTLQGRVTVRHLLDVLAKDLGPRRLAPKVVRPLAGLSVAPYYGCQCLRPYRVFDDPEAPRSMEPLLEAAGARVFEWEMGPKCCGAAHMTTHAEAGLTLTGAILAAARGADAIVTVCPMCQMNLEAHQNKISRREGRDLGVSVLYLPQLLGLALGIEPARLGLERNLALGAAWRARLARGLPATAAREAAP